MNLFEIMGDLSNLGDAFQMMITCSIIAFIWVVVLWLVVYYGVKIVVNTIRKIKNKKSNKK